MKWFLVLLVFQLLSCKTSERVSQEQEKLKESCKRLSKLASYLEPDGEGAYRFNHDKLDLPDGWEASLMNSDEWDILRYPINAKYNLYNHMIDSLLDSTALNYTKIHYTEIQKCFVKETDGRVASDFERSNLSYRIRTERNQSCYHHSGPIAPCNFLTMEIDSSGFLSEIRGEIQPDTIYWEGFYR